MTPRLYHKIQPGFSIPSQKISDVLVHFEAPDLSVTLIKEK